MEKNKKRKERKPQDTQFKMRLSHIVNYVLSYSSIRFVLLIIICIATAYLWFMTDQGSINPHRINVNLGHHSDFVDSLVNRGLNSKEPFNNVCLKLMLNDKSIDSLTKGKYKNAIEVDFEVYFSEIHLMFPTNYNSPLREKAVYKSIYIQDPVELYVNSIPKITKYSHKLLLEPLKIPSKKYKDSLGFLREEPYEVIIKDTAVYDVRLNSDSSLKMSIEVPRYKSTLTGQKVSPKYKVFFFSDDFGVSKNDPYYYYYISFPTEKFIGELRIAIDLYGNGMSVDSNSGDLCKNFQYEYIYPEPDAINNGKIEYFSKEKKKLIEKSKGIVVQAVDIDAQNRQKRKSFILSVPIGTGLAFILDRIMQLIKNPKKKLKKTIIKKNHTRKRK